MKRNKTTVGWLYCYVHFVTEIACFYVLSHSFEGNRFLWTVPLIYDCLAFVPQSLIGAFCDRFRKNGSGLIGTVLLCAGVIFTSITVLPGRYTALVVLCLGNACLHISGAETTLKCSDGKLSDSAVFVGGGSFGVITGRLLSMANLPFVVIALLTLTMIPFILLADTYRHNVEKENKCPCALFNCHSKKLSPILVVILAVFVVAVRGYMGYGIPTSWNKTVVQNVLFYSMMGIGKMLGGVVSDIIGIRKTAVISVAVSLPFLLFGDSIMLVSLVGVMLFSMTMPITLAVLVSVLKNAPGLAFGLTTIGLFLGTAPIFFFEFTTIFANASVITVLSAVCLVILFLITGRAKTAHG